MWGVRKGRVIFNPNTTRKYVLWQGRNPWEKHHNPEKEIFVKGFVKGKMPSKTSYHKSFAMGSSLCENPVKRLELTNTLLTDLTWCQFACQQFTRGFPLSNFEFLFLKIYEGLFLCQSLNLFKISNLSY